MPGISTKATAILHQAFDLLNPSDGTGPVEQMLYRTKVEGYVDPATGTWVDASSTDISFYGLRYDFSWIERQNMKDFEEGDAKVALKTPTEFTPSPGGYIIINEEEWNIISSPSDALGAMVYLQIRRQT